MRKQNTISQFYLLVILISGIVINCGKWKEQDLPQDEGVSLSFNYDSLVNCARAFTPAIGKQGGTLTLPLYAEPATFNPILAPGAVPHMYEGLVRINGATGEPQPCLAEDWIVSEDNCEWKFFIRRNVLWSDSIPFSAYDVAFTFNELIYNKNIPPNISRDMFTINSDRMRVTVLDSFTVIFILPKVFAPFIGYMTQEILPKHAYEKWLKNSAFSDSLSVKTSPRIMVGTGPFLLASYTPYSNLTCVRNPLYWRLDSVGNSLPYLDSIIYIIVSDLDEAQESFKNGEIDYLAADGNDYAKLDENDSAYSLFHLGPALGSNCILFNVNSRVDSGSGKLYVDAKKMAWFWNKNFRKAVAHAINRQRIIDVYMKGRGYPQCSPLSPAVGNFYNPAVVTYLYNLQKAGTLLREEGFTDRNGDGFLEDPDSNTIEFNLVVNSGNTLRKNIAEIICMDLERLGIKVHLNSIDKKIMYKNLYHPPYDWDMVMLGFSGGFEPHLGRDIWQSSGKHHLWAPGHQKPATQWETRINHLFDAGTAILDKEGRQAIYHEWQYIASDELPMIFTVRSERILGISNRVKNVNPAVHGGLLHTIEKLFIKN